MAKITYDDKEIYVDGSTNSQYFRYQDANEIKNVVNINDTNLERVDTRLKHIYEIVSQETTQTGTELTINNTFADNMKLGLKGNTSQEGTPTPDTPIPVQVVTGNNSIKVEGKNLFNKNNVIDGYRLGNNGTNFPNPGYSVTDFIKVKPSTNFYRNTDITLMEAVCLYDKDKNSISRLQHGNAFTTTENTYYIKTDVENTHLDTTQLEKGSTATTYEPYQSQTYPINLGSLELCKIGDYQDYFYKSGSKWYLHKEIGKVIYDGSENWEDRPNYTNADRFVLPENRIPIQPINGYSKYFVVYKDVIDEMGISENHGSQIVINFSTKGSTTLVQFKEWLSTHNTSIYYVLATATDTEITDTTLIEQLNNILNAQSYDYQTNITQTNAVLPFIITATARVERS